MKLRTFSKLVAAGIIAAITSCKPTGGTSTWSTDKVKVVTTTTMITDLVQQIGGDKVEVKGLMNHKIDPHGYEQTHDDTQALNTADVIFYNGLHLEAKMQKGLEHKAKKGDLVYALGAVVTEAEMLMDGHEHDPHIWGDPTLWIRTIDIVRDGLIKADPSNKATYEANAAAYKIELETLNTWVKSRVEEIPAQQRALVTAHDAFGYFASAYGFEVRGLQGLSSADESGVKAATDLADYIKSKGIKEIFAESTTNNKGLAEVAKQAGVKVSNIELYSDACGPIGATHTANGESYDVGTYTGMIKHNVNTIVDALK